MLFKCLSVHLSSFMLIWLYLSYFSLDAVKSVTFHLESVVMCVCACVCVRNP